ncbi:MAG TPA: cytochrome P450 [Anaerolineae bacterium]
MSVSGIERELNPFPWYQAMRQQAPVYYDRERWTWNVFGYDDVQRTLSEYATFSSQFHGSGGGDGSQPFAASLIGTDPPRHRQLRSLVTQAFTPRAVDALAPRIAAIVDELLDRGAAPGRLDAIRDFGDPLPVIVIAELLGIPAADRGRFKTWSDAVVSMSETESAGGYEGAVREMSAYFLALMEERRSKPAEDLISGLLAAEIDGQHLSRAEMLGFGSLLLVAGNETTTNLIGNALLCFVERPELWARLRAERSLLPGAIEEVLRYRSPVQSMFRVTTTAARLQNQTIPAGAFVVAWIGSANHDERQFADPERFDIERTPNRHLAFGQGIHYCLGAPLARLETRIAMEALLDRYSAIEQVAGQPLERLPSTIVYGLRNLPLRLNE